MWRRRISRLRHLRSAASLRACTTCARTKTALYFQDNSRSTNAPDAEPGPALAVQPLPERQVQHLLELRPEEHGDRAGAATSTPCTKSAPRPRRWSTALKGYGAKFETAEEAGLPSKLVNDNWLDIGPHVGFAYRALDGRKSFVMRGGFSTSLLLDPDLRLERPHADQRAVRRLLPELSS